jgi:hypothetical protein
MKAISSRATGFYKIFPFVWSLGFGQGVIGLFFGAYRDSGGNNPPDLMKWLFLGIWVAVSIVAYCLFASLKVVRVGDDTLRISNFFSEESIPTSEIGNITENCWINIHPVTIHLKRPTKFGNKIRFMPKMRFFNIGSHPVVGELRAVAGFRPAT